MDYKRVFFSPKLTKSLRVVGREDEQIPTSSILQPYGGSPEMLAHAVVKMLHRQCVFTQHVARLRDLLKSTNVVWEGGAYSCTCN